MVVFVGEEHCVEEHLHVSSGEKENSLKTDDYGRDLSSVQTLLTKQVLLLLLLLPLLLFLLLSSSDVVFSWLSCVCRRPLTQVCRPSSRRASATSRHCRSSCWPPSTSNPRPSRLGTPPFSSAGTSCFQTLLPARRSCWRLRSISERSPFDPPALLQPSCSCYLWTAYEVFTNIENHQAGLAT